MIRRIVMASIRCDAGPSAVGGIVIFHPAGQNGYRRIFFCVQTIASLCLTLERMLADL
jgi:hypothetical protein